MRASLKAVDGLFISSLVNVRYLTGFTGSSAFMLIGRKSAFFITDPRYGKDAIKDAGPCYEPVVIGKAKFPPLVKKLSEKAGIKRLGFETSASYALYERLKAAGLELKPAKGLVERIRMVKGPEEVESMKAAIRRAEEAFIKLKPYIKTGVTETALARRFEEMLRMGGRAQLPFPVIAASGPNAAIPHARPTGRKLAPGDLLILDWGSESGGYFSDMTRTLLIPGGDHTAEKKKIYNIVLDANREAISFAASGKTASQIDNSARYVIKQAGYGAYFAHATGHGIGLEVHEFPGISRGSAVPVRDGMVFTIEPGIYVPGLGGVRIEDMVIMEKGRARPLTRLPKDLRMNTLGGK